MKLTRRTVLNTFALATAGTLSHPLKSALAEAWAQTEPLTDPHRPAYHLLPARGWINDPCAPIYWRGEYHMFHQYNPNAAVWGDMHWAHAVSPDMVHWQRLPVALAPTPGGPDAQGCFTGSSIVYNGDPAIIYTGVQTVPLAEATLSDGHNNFRETQLLATAADNTLGTWKKHPQPVIPAPPPDMKVTGFRDPTPFRDGDTQYLLVASGISKVGGNVLLYRSKDLTQWEYLHPMVQGSWSGTPGANPVDTGEMWECPDFFPLGTGGKHVLIYSTQGKTLWHSGTLDKKTMLFHTERSGQLDYGKGSYYAPKTQLDAKGNRILWGWIRETRPEAEYNRAGWAGMISLPRILTLNSNDLMMEPAPQTERLRASTNPNPAQLPNTRQEFRCVLQSATAGEPLPYRITDPTGTILEIRSAKDQSPRTILIDDIAIELPEPLPAQAGLHLFLDNSVFEIFIDSRFCATRRFYARTPGKPVATLTLPGQPRVARPQSFSLSSIWPT
ncbi:MAG TPA: glycoside hydrolase family 32 protein [Edaphobacter sp.]